MWTIFTNRWQALGRQVQFRPALWVAIGLALGISTAFFRGNGLFLLAFLALLPQWRFALVVVLSMALGFALAPQRLASGLKERTYFRGEVTVTSMPRNTSDGYLFTVHSPEGDFVAATGTRFDLSLGDRARVMGWRVPLGEAGEQRWLNQGYGSQLKLKVPPEVIQPGPKIWRWSLALRDRFTSFAASALSRKDAQLLDAMCFNQRAELDLDTQESFNLSGLSHLLAASGATVFILIGGLMLVLERIPLPRWALLWVCLWLLLLYVGAAALTPSANRALGMAAMVLVAYLFRSEFDILSALAASFCLNLLVDPSALQDIGFQISYACLFGLSLFFDRRPELSSGRQRVAALWKMSLLGWGLSAPLVAYHMHYVSLSGIFSTFLVSGLYTVLILGGFACWIGSMITMGVMNPMFGYFMKPILTLMAGAATACSQPFFFLPVRPFSAYWLVALYAALFLAWNPRRRPSI